MTGGLNSTKEFIALGITTIIWTSASALTSTMTDPTLAHYALSSLVTLLETSVLFTAFKLLSPKTFQQLLNASEYIACSLCQAPYYIFNSFESLYEKIQALYQEYLNQKHYEAVGETLSTELSLEEYPHLANEILERIALFTTAGYFHHTQAFMTGWDRNRTQQMLSERLHNSTKRKADNIENSESESAKENKIEIKPKKRSKKESSTPKIQPRRSVRLAIKANKRKAQVLDEDKSKTSKTKKKHSTSKRQSSKRQRVA